LITIFSYLVSSSQRKNFKEPLLLAEMEHRLLPAAAKPLVLPTGWSSHYSIGVVWPGFLVWYSKMNIKPAYKTGLILGIFSGLVAVAISRATSKALRNPHKINHQQFFLHLVLAHIVYSLSVVFTSKEQPSLSKVFT